MISEILNRSYFPNVDLGNLNPEQKAEIIEDIEKDFDMALIGIKNLPNSSRFGVYTAYVYYKKLLKKLKRVPSTKLLERRVRVGDSAKLALMMKSYLDVRFNLL